MKEKILISILLIVVINQIQSQEIIDKLDYPIGIYETKIDFLNKTPSSNYILTTKEIPLIIDNDSIIERCYFYNKQTKKKIKKAFAISYEGYLYFRTGAILENRNKEDKSVSGSKYVFALVRQGGKNFLYTEAGFINHWKAGLSSGVSSGVGGLIGYELGKAVEKSFPQTTEYGTGAVWDIKNKEFNIFSNCKDYNEFIKNHSEKQLDCGNEIFDLNTIRNDIENIK